jgi:hypothetical protein
MKRKQKRISKKTRGARTKLRLPDLDQAKTAVLNTLRSPRVTAWVSTRYR